MPDNRNYLMCPFCYMVTCWLSVHLRRKCMKGRPKADMENVLEESKERKNEFVREHQVLSYSLVSRRLDVTEDALGKMVPFLEMVGHVVTGKPATDGRATESINASNTLAVTETRAVKRKRRFEEAVDLGTLGNGDEQVAFGSAEKDSPIPSVSPESNSSRSQEESSSSDLEGGVKQTKPRWSHPGRKAMEAKGMYSLHELEHPILNQYAKYLRKFAKLKLSAWRQQVKNVSRILFYCEPARVDLASLVPEKVMDFMQDILGAGLSQQTVKNYQISLKRFLVYLMNSTSLDTENSSLYAKLKKLKTTISVWGKVTQQGVSREEIALRVERTTSRDAKSLNDCQELLRIAFKDFKAALDAEELTLTNYLTVVNYLTSLLCLKHCQRKGVVEGFRLTEWVAGVELTVDEKPYWTYYVLDHKTSATQPAIFCLEEEEHNWFVQYFTRYRPSVAGLNGAQTEYFFLSTTGKRIYNASNDINRYHRKYKLPSATASEARRAMETSTRGMFSQAECSLVEDYLAHSAAVAGKFYRFLKPINVCRARMLIERTVTASARDNLIAPGLHSMAKAATASEDTMVESQPDDRNKSHVESPQPSTSTSCVRPSACRRNSFDLTKAFTRMAAVYPVTVDGRAPSLRFAKSFYDFKPKCLVWKWVYLQTEARVAYIRDLFPRRRPKRQEIINLVTKRGWPPHLVAKVMAQLVLVPARGHRRRPEFHSHVETQNWPGLAVGTHPKRGNVLLITRAFQKGDIVTDYHGEVISFAEGERRQQDVVESGYIFFIPHKDMAIDASSPSCLCHAGKTLYGRLASHSSKGKRTNVKPETHEVGGKTVVLFKALRDIDAGEEIFFDYGVRRHQFQEGGDLEWLD